MEAPSVGLIILFAFVGSLIFAALVYGIDYMRSRIDMIKTIHGWGYSYITPHFAKIYRVPRWMAKINNVLIDKTQVGRIKFWSLVILIITLVVVFS